MRPWLEGFVFLVVPGIFGVISFLVENFFGIPVFFFAFQELASFNQKNPFTRFGELAGKRSTTGSRADDDHVVMFVEHPKLHS